MTTKDSNISNRLHERRNAECLDDLSSTSNRSVLPSYSHSPSSASLSSSVSSSWSRDSRKSSFPSTISANSSSSKSNTLHPLSTTLETHMMELRVDSCLNSPESDSTKVYPNNINGNNNIAFNNISNIFNRTKFTNSSSSSSSSSAIPATSVEIPMKYPAPKKKERKKITESPNSIEKFQLRGPVNSDNAKKALRERLQHASTSSTNPTAATTNASSTSPPIDIPRTSSFRKFDTSTSYAISSLSLAGQNIIDSFATSPYSSAKSPSADELERIHEESNKFNLQPPVSPRLQKYTNNSPTLFSPSPSSFISKRSCVAFSPLRPVPPVVTTSSLTSSSSTAISVSAAGTDSLTTVQQQQQQLQYNYNGQRQHQQHQQQQPFQRNSPLFSMSTSFDDNNNSHGNQMNGKYNSNNKNTQDNNTTYNNNSTADSNVDIDISNNGIINNIHNSRDRGIFQNRRTTSSKGSTNTNTNTTSSKAVGVTNIKTCSSTSTSDTDKEATYLDSSGYTTTSSGHSSVVYNSIGNMQSSIGSSTGKYSVYNSIGSSTGSNTSSFRLTGFRNNNFNNHNQLNSPNINHSDNIDYNSNASNNKNTQ